MLNNPANPVALERDFAALLDRCDAAKAAGANRVVPNSKLAEDLPALARRYVTSGTTVSASGDEDEDQDTAE